MGEPTSDESDERKQEPLAGTDATSLPRWIWWLTILWVVVLIALVAFSKPCDALAPLWRPASRYLACMQANEVGDFLAGAFAPLAFLWLIATVVIQARELRAQRQELRLTRREFEANRKVAEAQAVEARRQAEFIGAQTEILKDEQRLNREMRADKEYDACIEAIARAALALIGKGLAFSEPNQSIQSLHLTTGAPPLAVAIQALAAFERMGETLTNVPKLRIVSVTEETRTIFGLIEEIAELRYEVTPAKRVEARALPIDQILQIRDLLMARFGEEPIA